ncbi:MAG: hypothetical protein HXX13_07410 [Bacteroidetes bacterium]|nr:hypothetical protein [Bacteroidota bacterium]
MISKRPLNKVKCILVSILAGIIVFASCGFAYHIHYCHGSRASASYYPGLFQNVAGCGCESGSNTMKAASHFHSGTAISKSGCCNNYKFFQKVPTISFSDFFGKIKFVEVVQSGILASTLDRIQPVQPSVPILLSHHPPPKSGKSLVFRFHQIRIPSFPGDC